MHARQSFLTSAAPHTPNINLNADSSPDASPVLDIHRTGASSPARAAALSASQRSTSSQTDYLSGAGDEKKYPPNGHHGSSASLPLLADEGDETDATFSKVGKRPFLANNVGASHSDVFGSLVQAVQTAFYNTRGRMHPWALFPAVLLGMAIALTYSNYGVSSHLPESFYQLHRSGLMFFHPAAIENPLVGHVKHPIRILMEDGEKAWKSKLQRQSKTLEEAVREYRRRYGRKPPKGFDDWFRFAQQNEVKLIDEFDVVHRDTNIFWALRPETLQARALAMQEDPSTFTFVVKSGEVDIIGPRKTEPRAEDQADLMKRWKHWLPDVNISMAAHDGPSLLMSEKDKKRHLDAVAARVYLTDAEAEMVDEDASWWGFALSCPADSRVRTFANGQETDVLPKGHSYIADHSTAMDMCQNPEYQYLHGFTAWPGQRPKVLSPVFSFAKTHMHSDLLCAPLEQYWNHEPWDPDWEKKPNNKAFWRGTTTGVWFDRTTFWRSSQRVRLFFTMKDRSSYHEVHFVEKHRSSESIVKRNVSTAELVDRYLDFGFTGRQSQCSESDGTCDAIPKIIEFLPTIGWPEANEYKYLLDIDGNAWSGRFHRLLTTKSVVLKSTIFPEWYADWIQPWVHYVPLKVDYTDLWDIMAYFSGDLSHSNHHEEEAKKIARQGQEYAANHWRYEDMEAYFFRLSLEWARLTSPNRATADYEGPGTA